MSWRVHRFNPGPNGLCECGLPKLHPNATHYWPAAVSADTNIKLTAVATRSKRDK